jgi:hypothetical protein
MTETENENDTKSLGKSDAHPAIPEDFVQEIKSLIKTYQRRLSSMVKKRTKLSGQGKKMFFSDADSQLEAEEKESVTESGKVKGSESSGKSDAPPAVPEDFVQKVKAIKETIRQFKELVDQDVFKDFRGKDFKK